MIKQKSIKKNYIYNLLNLVSTSIIPLVTYPYITRILGPSGLGKVNFAISISSYFILVASLGIPTYGIRAIAVARDDNKRLNRTVHELFFINAIMSILCTVALLIITFLFPQLREIALLMFINAINVIMTPFSLNWFYQGIEEYQYITIRNVAFKILSVFLIFIFIKNSNDYYIYAIIVVIQTSGAYIINFLHLRKYVSFKLQRNYQIRNHLKPIFTFFAMSAATNIYIALPNTILGFLKGDEAVGFFSVSQKINTVLLQCCVALGTVLLPRLSYYIEKKEMGQFNAIVKKSINFTLALACPIVGYLMLNAKYLIVVFAGDKYDASVLPLQILSFILIFAGLSNVTGIQVLIPMKNERITTASVILGAVVGIILFFFLIPPYSVVGTAISCAIVEVFVLAFQLIFIKRKMNISIITKGFYKYFVAAFAALVVNYLVSLFLNVGFLLQLILSFIVYSIFYVVSLCLLKDSTVKYGIDTILRFMRGVANHGNR